MLRIKAKVFSGAFIFAAFIGAGVLLGGAATNGTVFGFSFLDSPGAFDSL